VKVNQKLDKPLLVCGITFVLLGLVYKSRNLLPVEFSELFFWLSKDQDGYYKLVESEPEFKLGLVFFLIGLVVLVFRRLTIRVKGSDV
jgi:hypothetical protein